MKFKLNDYVRFDYNKIIGIGIIIEDKSFGTIYYHVTIITCENSGYTHLINTVYPFAEDELKHATEKEIQTIKKIMVFK